MDSPRQAAGSSDSGPITCYMVERLMSAEEIENEEWSVDVAGEYRARIASLLHEAIHKALAR